MFPSFLLDTIVPDDKYDSVIYCLIVILIGMFAYLVYLNIQINKKAKK